MALDTTDHRMAAPQVGREARFFIHPDQLGQQGQGDHLAVGAGPGGAGAAVVGVTAMWLRSSTTHRWPSLHGTGVA